MITPEAPSRDNPQPPPTSSGPPLTTNSLSAPTISGEFQQQPLTSSGHLPITHSPSVPTASKLITLEKIRCAASPEPASSETLLINSTNSLVVAVLIPLSPHHPSAPPVFHLTQPPNFSNAPLDPPLVAQEIEFLPVSVEHVFQEKDMVVILSAEVLQEPL